MSKRIEWRYPRGKGRPQIILLGNGLENQFGQMETKQLIKELRVPNAIEITEDLEKIPFPLLYELISAPLPAKEHLSSEDIAAEENRLRDAILKLKTQSTEQMDRLPALNADHIFTTNYSYCLEKAFFPKRDFEKASTRSALRFECAEREVYYRLHTGYLAKSSDRQTGLWHIHGEYSVPRGIILGHDRYGRLIQHIGKVCHKLSYRDIRENEGMQTFTSWPELFLFGDVYILGLKMAECEHDLWWLLRRKQRERFSEGCVKFYARRPNGGFKEPRHLLLQANGVEILDADADTSVDYPEFYNRALDDIGRRIAQQRKG